jgi:uncharacterized glyoxalase superfamily protein PhnB
MSTTLASNEVTMYPFIRYQDAPAAIGWLVQAFGLEARAVHPGPDNTIAHAELGFGGSSLMLGSAKDDEFRLKSPRELGGVTQGVYMYVPDIDAHHARAKTAGAEIVYELRNTDYGSREYAARDLEGNLWSFGTYKPGATTTA